MIMMRRSEEVRKREEQSVLGKGYLEREECQKREAENSKQNVP